MLGSGTITLMNEISSLTGYREIINTNLPNNRFFLTSGAAFILLGLIIIFFNKRRK